MMGMIHVEVNTPSGAGQTHIEGQLKFQQDEPILIDSITRTLFNYDPITNAF